MSNILEVPQQHAIQALIAKRWSLRHIARTLGINSKEGLFALRVRGDSMIGRHIVNGDCVILDRNRPPRPGDVVAALIDQESTLKTFAFERGRPVLQAENPLYPTLVPAENLAIQGVMVGLVRRGS